MDSKNKEDYVKFMNQVLSSGDAEEAPVLAQQKGVKWYIPNCYGCRAATVEKPKCHVAKLFVAAKLRSGYTLLID